MPDVVIRKVGCFDMSSIALLTVSDVSFGTLDCVYTGISVLKAGTRSEVHRSRSQKPWLTMIEGGRGVGPKSRRS